MHLDPNSVGFTSRLSASWVCPEHDKKKDVTPENVGPSSKLKVWWQHVDPAGKEVHEWYSTIKCTMPHLPDDSNQGAFEESKGPDKEGI